MQTSRQRGRDAFTAQLIPSGHSDGSWQTLPYQKLQWEEKWWGKKSQHLKEGWRRDAKRLQDAAPGRGGKNWAMQVCAHAAWWVSGKEEEIRERTL